jgi:galactokinase/mevalonate kinase-like predicted kinase
LLDSGTSPAAVNVIFERIEDLCAGAKLCGAGGGGYLFMLAKSPDAAARIRAALSGNPPNARARFVDMKISKTGMRITRS